MPPMPRWLPTHATHATLACHPCWHLTLLAGQVSAGGRHTLLLAADNQLWGFGDGENGQLGVGVSGKQMTPVKV